DNCYAEFGESVVSVHTLHTRRALAAISRIVDSSLPGDSQNADKQLGYAYRFALGRRIGAIGWDTRGSRVRALASSCTMPCTPMANRAAIQSCSVASPPTSGSMWKDAKTNEVKTCERRALTRIRSCNALEQPVCERPGRVKPRLLCHCVFNSL